MSVTRWVAAAVVVVSAATIVVVTRPEASPPPPAAEVRSPTLPVTASRRTPSSSDQQLAEVREEPSAQRARTLAAEDALAERSTVARMALIKRQRTRLQRSVALAESEGNPARTRILRERLDDLERLAQEPLE